MIWAADDYISCPSFDSISGEIVIAPSYLIHVLSSSKITSAELGTIFYRSL